MSHEEENRLYYSPVYGRLLIALGILFTAIFILGYFIAGITESIFYCMLTAIIIIVGFGILNGPYAVYDEEVLILFTYGFKEKQRIKYKDKSEITVKSNHLYHNGKKIKMNDWFIRKADWNRMIQFYSSSDESLLSELKD